MRLSISTICALLAIGAIAVPTPPSTHVVHERRSVTPKYWKRHSKLHVDTPLPVRIGLTQSNLSAGYDILMEISAHDSPKYGQHLTAQEVHDLFAPAQESVDAVKAWVSANGIDLERTSISTNKQWLQFDATTDEMEKLLHTEYHVYEHEISGTKTVACDQYHIPADVQSHVDYITPGIKLFSTKVGKKGLDKRTFGVTGAGPVTKPQLRPLPNGLTFADIAGPLDTSAQCDTTITPACIKQMYNITAGTTAFAGNQLGIFEDLDDIYSQTDLNDFFKTFATNIPAGTGPTLHGVDGGTAPETVLRDAGPESDLDFQMSIPIIFPQSTILFQTDDPVYEADYVFEGFFNTFLDAIDGSYCSFVDFGDGSPDPLDPPYPDPSNKAGAFKGSLQCGVYTPTNVISVSYGGQEFDLPAAYQQRQCAEYMKLGMQGVTLVFASGDAGVAGPAGDDSSNGCLGAKDTVFSPTFPNTCPFVTNAGSTTLPSGANVNADAEIATTRFGSGGGFSNIYPIPSYQSSAVANFFATADPPYASYTTFDVTNPGANGGLYNKAGRAYPDVSAVGDNVVVFIGGEEGLIGGTSAAAPCFASIMVRINEERLAAGKTTVGFVNPVIYANPSAFHDITKGTNPGCGTVGFTAAKGWDPVTGLGTPDFPSLLEVFMALP